MKPELLDLMPDMVLFVAVAKAKNFSRAARALQMPISTVSRRVAELEGRIGLQLLTRTTRRVELTETGARYYDRCCAIVEAAEAAHAELKDDLEQPQGQLRISATADFAGTFLTPLCAEFARRYEGISFEFDLTPRAVDLVAEGYDVAIRMGRLPDSGLTVRTLGAARNAIYASTAYLDSAGVPRDPADLARHQCLRILRRADDKTRWSLIRDNRQVDVVVKGRFVANNIRILQQLASLGMGIAMIDVALARPEVDAGRLVQVLPDWHSPPVPVHALTPSRFLPAKTRLFLDCLSRRLSLE